MHYFNEQTGAACEGIACLGGQANKYEPRFALYLEIMLDTPKQIRRAAQTAARELKELGWPVQRYGKEAGTWQIGDALLADGDLIDFAAWAPKWEPRERTSTRATRSHRDPRAPLEATEALEYIRAVMDFVIPPDVDEPSASALRLIRATLDKVPRPRTFVGMDVRGDRP